MDAIIATDTDNTLQPCNCIGPQNGDPACPCAMRGMKTRTPDKREPMPRTVEHYQALAQRDLELIEEQRAEIGRLKGKINSLEQKVDKYRRLYTQNR